MKMERKMISEVGHKYIVYNDAFGIPEYILMDHNNSNFRRDRRFYKIISVNDGSYIRYNGVIWYINRRPEV